MNRFSRRLAAASGLVAGVMAALLSGCGDDAPPRRASDPGPLITRDVPDILRGTVGADASVSGIDPVLVSGFGLVVGLNGSGGGPYPEPVQATMERELSRGGVGAGSALAGGALAGLTPRQVLASTDVAVVIVEGILASGLSEGTEFDVQVRAIPGSGTTSLEGGSLWTAELREGIVSPFGAMRTPKRAEAEGTIFINPFADPAGGRVEIADRVAPALEGDGVVRTVGRIISGGRITSPRPLDVILDNASHLRARAVVAAINSRFPPGPGDRAVTAMGRSDQIITVRIPRAWRKRPDEFIQIIKHLRIDATPPELAAKRYADELARTPGLAEDLSWCMIALGRAALPFLSPFYESPELAPKLAALRAGALLDDPRAVQPLIALARAESQALRATPAVRSQAIDLLGRMSPEPFGNQALRELLDAPELDVRASAYHALVERRDPAVRRIVVGRTAELIGESGTGAQFHIDTVPSTRPLIYIVQEGVPRVVLFGEGSRLLRPAVTSLWNGRFLLTTRDEGSDLNKADIFFRDFRTGRAQRRTVDDDLTRFVKFLGHQSTPEEPEPGLGMTFSEVVGVLYALTRQDAVASSFATENDRLMARVMDASLISTPDRPVSEASRAREEASRARMMAEGRAAIERAVQDSRTPTAREPGSLLVPITPPRRD